MHPCRKVYGLGRGSIGPALVRGTSSEASCCAVITGSPCCEHAFKIAFVGSTPLIATNRSFSRSQQPSGKNASETDSAPKP